MISGFLFIKETWLNYIRKHPKVAKAFNDGKFTVQKINRVFSAIATDQAHEQNNTHIKGDGGAVELTDNPSALRRWMVVGPEVAKVIDDFHDQKHHCRIDVDYVTMIKLQTSRLH